MQTPCCLEKIKNSLVLFLLILLICLIFVGNLLIPFLELSIGASGIDQFRYWVIILTYVCAIFTVFLNRDNLAIYNIDKLSLLILILAGGIRVNLHVPNEMSYKNIILALGLILLCITMLNWNKIPSTNMRWIFVGLLASFLVLPLALAESFQVSKYSVSNALYGDHFWRYAVRNFTYQLAFVGPFEEIIFRSILWGELRKRQFGEEKIIWIQGLLFWSVHFWNIFTPITFFIVLPVGIITYSLLVKYSKQISPSMILHTLLNVLGAISVYFLSTIV